MKKYIFKVGNKDSNKRLDHYLIKNLPSSYSRSFIQQLISNNYILLDGKPIKAHHKIKSNDIITIDMPERKRKNEILPENIPLDIIFEDEELLVINKPSGMVVHPAGGNYSQTLVNALLYHCDSLSKIGDITKRGIVHRLDKDTSGLMVVAKKDSAHQILAEQFKNRTIKRTYIGFVKGLVEFDEGSIDVPIGRDPKNRKKMTAKFSEKRYAITNYKVLNRFRDFTMLELTPKTGRTHQLRVHLAYIGHSLLGDSKYGKSDKKIDRQALHAKSLGFRHPMTGQFIEFSTELPDDMKRLISEES